MKPFSRYVYVVLFFAAIYFAGNALTQNSQCPVVQKRRLDRWMKQLPNPVPPNRQTSVADERQLEQVCMPNGQRAYLVAKGVFPPTFLAGEQQHDGEIIREATRGKRAIVMRVDGNGVPTAAYLIGTDHNLGQDVVKAFEQWRFSPATFNNKPVPVIFKLEIDFRLKNH